MDKLQEQFFKSMKGDKGDKPIAGLDYPIPKDGKDGYTPVKGKDYFTRTEVAQFKKEVTPVKGEDYLDGKDGADGIDGLNGKDGTDITPEQIAEKINTLKDMISPDSIKDFPHIHKVVQYLQESKALDYSHIKNTPDPKKINTNDLRWHGGGLTKGAFKYNIIPTGAINSVNKTFTLPDNPLSGTLAVYADGLRETPGGVDYTLSGKTITFITAPNTAVICDYMIKINL